MNDRYRAFEKLVVQLMRRPQVAAPAGRIYELFERLAVHAPETVIADLVRAAHAPVAAAKLLRRTRHANPGATALQHVYEMLCEQIRLYHGEYSHAINGRPGAGGSALKGAIDVLVTRWLRDQRWRRTGPKAVRSPFLTDGEWLLIADLFPDAAGSAGSGRPRTPSRKCLEGILWVMASGSRWEDLPGRYPAVATCRRRHREWIRTGAFQAARDRLLGKLGE